MATPRPLAHVPILTALPALAFLAGCNFVFPYEATSARRDAARGDTGYLDGAVSDRLASASENPRPLADGGDGPNRPHDQGPAVPDGPRPVDQALDAADAGDDMGIDCNDVQSWTCDEMSDTACKMSCGGTVLSCGWDNAKKQSQCMYSVQLPYWTNCGIMAETPLDCAACTAALVSGQCYP